MPVLKPALDYTQYNPNQYDPFAPAMPSAEQSVEQPAEQSVAGPDEYPPLSFDPKTAFGPQPSEATKGLISSWKQTQAFAGGTVALGAEALKNVAPDVLKPALDEASQWGLDVYKSKIAETEPGGQYAPAVPRIEDIGSIGDFGKWVAYQGAQGLGQLAQIALSGGVAGGVAKAALGTTVKSVAEAELGSIIGGRVVDKVAKEAAQKAISKALTRGATAGAAAASFSMEGGSQFGSQVQEGKNPAEVAPEAAVVGGINAMIELLPFGLAAKYLGIGSDAVKKSVWQEIKSVPELSKKAIALAKSALKAGAVGGAAEGVTEGIQELVQIAGDRWANKQGIYGSLTPDDWSRIANVSASAFLPGSVFGGAIGPFEGTAGKKPPPPPGAPAVPPAGTSAPPVPGATPVPPAGVAPTAPVPPAGATPIPTTPVPPTGAVPPTPTAPVTPASTPTPTPEVPVGWHQVSDTVAQKGAWQIVHNPETETFTAIDVTGAQKEEAFDSFEEAAGFVDANLGTVETPGVLANGMPVPGGQVENAAIPSEEAVLTRTVEAATGAGGPTSGATIPAVATAETAGTVPAGEQPGGRASGAIPASVRSGGIKEVTPNGVQEEGQGAEAANTVYDVVNKKGEVIGTMSSPNNLAKWAKRNKAKIEDLTVVPHEVTPNAETIRGDQGPVREGSQEGLQEVQPVPEQGRGDLQLNPEEEGRPDVAGTNEERGQSQEASLVESKPKTVQKATATNVRQAIENEPGLGRNWLARAEKYGLIEIHEGPSPTGASGTFDPSTGKMHLYAGSMPTDGSIAGVVLHEGSHQNLETMLGGKLFGEYVKRFDALWSKGDETAKLAGTTALNRVAERLGIANRLADESITPEERVAEAKRVEEAVNSTLEGKAMLAEEKLAYYTQFAKDNPTGLFRSIIAALKAAWVSSALGKAFAKAGLMPQLTDELMVALARRATKLSVAMAQDMERLGAVTPEEFFKSGRFDETFSGIKLPAYDSQLPWEKEVVKTGLLESHIGTLPAIERAPEILAASTGVQVRYAQDMLAQAVFLEKRAKELGYAGLEDLPEGEFTKAAEEWRAKHSLESQSGAFPLFSKQWFLTDPTSQNVDEVNRPGKLQFLLADYVDRFNDILKRSQPVYEKFGAVAAKKGAAVQEHHDRYLKPMLELVKKWGKTVEETGLAIAARHVVLDDVNRKLSEDNSLDFVKRLEKAKASNKKFLLTPALRSKLHEERRNVEKGLLPDGSQHIDLNGNPRDLNKTERRQEMYNLVEKYMALSNDYTRKYDLWVEWENFKHHASGFSIGDTMSQAFLKKNAAGEYIVENAPARIYAAREASQHYDTNIGADPTFTQLTALWDGLVKEELAIRLEGGLIQQEEYTALTTRYPHFAPLRRIEFDLPDEVAKLLGQGTGPGKGIMARAGSSIPMDPIHVLQNGLAKIDAASSAAERNKAMNFLANQIYADKEGWKEWFTIQEDKGYATRDDNGFIIERQSTQTSDTDMRLIRGGKRLIITPTQENIRAAQFARAVNNLDAKVLDGPMAIMGWVNQWIRAMNITLSPVFGVANMIRDPFAAAYNLQASEAKDYVWAIFKEYKNSFRALKKVFLDGVTDPADPDVQRVKQFQKAGGQASFVGSLKPMDSSWNSFEAMAKRRNTPLLGSMIQWGKPKLEFMENLNEVFENVMRLSTYTVLKDKVANITDERAARVAREVTTDFTRKGFKSQALGTWWLFFNATVSGNYTVVRNLLQSKKLQTAVGGTILFSLLIDSLGRAFSDDEDGDGRSDWDSIPEWEKEKYIHFPFKVGGLYPKIPAPWVYNVVWRFGQLLGETFAGQRDIPSVFTSTAGNMIDAFNPLGGKDTTVAQLLSPTALDPLVQIWENKDFAGNPLGPEGYPGAGKRPDAYMAWDTMPQGYKDAAKWINNLTGGTPAESGAIDLRPSTYKVLADTLMGSSGRLIQQIFGLGEDVLSGKELTQKTFPLAHTFTSVASDPMESQLYHERVAKVYGAHQSELRYRTGPDRDFAALSQLRATRAGELRMYDFAQDVERQLTSLRKQMNLAITRGDEVGAKRIKATMDLARQRFNQTWVRRVGN